MFNLILKDILIQKKTFLFGAVYIMIVPQKARKYKQI